LVKIEAPQGLISSGIGTKERFTETGTAIHTDWYESDFEYHVVARFLVAAERKNMRLYVEKSQIVIEAVKDPTGIQGPTLAPNTKRMSLFLRRKIEIPPNADLKKISSKIVGDTILITIPKKKFSSL
jgi:HSP20 family molecular chaperone IbpA